MAEEELNEPERPESQAPETEKSATPVSLKRRRFLIISIVGGGIGIGVAAGSLYLSQILQRTPLRELGRFVTRTLPGELLESYSGELTVGVYQLSWSPDGKRLASVGSNQVMHVWEIGKVYGNVQVHLGVINGLWSVDGSVIASSTRDHQIQLWDSQSGQEQRMLRQQHTLPVPLQWIDDSSRLLVLGKPDETQLFSAGLQVWETQTGEIQSRKLIEDWPAVWAISPTSTQVALANNGGVEIRPLLTEQGDMHKWKTGTEDVSPVALDWSWSERYIALRWETGLIQVINSKTGKIVWEKSIAPSQASLLASKIRFSRDEKRLAILNGDHVLILKVATGQEYLRIAGHQGILRDFCWSPSGSMMATCGAFEDNVIHIWRIV